MLTMGNDKQTWIGTMVGTGWQAAKSEGTMMGMHTQCCPVMAGVAWCHMQCLVPVIARCLPNALPPLQNRHYLPRKPAGLSQEILVGAVIEDFRSV